MKKFAGGAMAAFALLLLTACTAVTGSITVTKEAKVTGTYEISVTKESAKFMGAETPDDLIPRFNTIGQGSGFAVTDQECSASEREGNYVVSCSFPEQALNDPNSGIQVKAAEGGLVEFFLFSKGNPQAFSESVNDPNYDMGSVIVTVDMPGEIVEISGDNVRKSDADSFVIEGGVVQPMNGRVVSNTIPVGGGVPIPLILGVFILALAGGAGWFYFKRVRSGEESGVSLETFAEETVTVESVPSDPAEVIDSPAPAQPIVKERFIKAESGAAAEEALHVFDAAISGNLDESPELSGGGAAGGRAFGSSGIKDEDWVAGED